MTAGCCRCWAPPGAREAHSARNSNSHTVLVYCVKADSAPQSARAAQSARAHTTINALNTARLYEHFETFQNVHTAATTIKLPVTEEFLWDIFNAIADAADIVPDFHPYPNILTLVIGRRNSVERRYIGRLGRRKFGQLVSYLKRRGYIRIKNLESGQAMMLTKSGLGKALTASFEKEKKAKRKDGKLIMIAFDVPRNRRKERNILTSALHNLGYKLFQQSVWITPFDVFERTEQALRFHSLDRYVKIFLIEKM